MPPTLQADMERAVDAVPAARTVPDALADAALASLGRAAHTGADRVAAFHLLAADALMTAACQAAVEFDGDVAPFCDRFNAARIAAVLPPGAAAP